MISAETSLVGVIGNPIKHSLSPVIHNAALEAMDLNWCYLAIPCETKNLDLVLKALGTINCKGLNITIPHKQHSLNICKGISLIAKQIGAVNTLIPNSEGGWNGDNTDSEGFLAPLKLKNLKKKKAILIGCGGSARAVLTGLKLLDFQEIIIVGRKSKNLTMFLSDMSPNLSKYEKDVTPQIQGLLEDDEKLLTHIQTADLIVNATPVGMKGSKSQTNYSREMPLGEKIWASIKSSTIFYDLIYTPRPTPWLTNAEKIGCETIDGLEMLIQQGAASLKLWSGVQEIPIEIMRQAAEKHLKN